MTTGPQPLISVIIPIYNGLPYITNTINSVREQTYRNWELILCDNVSKDETVACIRQQLDERPDSRIRLIVHDEHLPMAQNWNRALSHAAGDLIKLLPSDDILLPQCLDIQAQLLQKHPDAGFVTSSKEIIDSNGTLLFIRTPLKEGLYDWSQMGKRSIYAVTNLLGEPAGILFRKDLLATCGDYDPVFRYFIDVDLLLRFLKKSKAFVYGKPLYQFRIHGTSASASSRQVAVTEYLQLLQKFESDLHLKGRPLLQHYLKFKASLIPGLRSLAFRFYLKSS